MTDPTFLHTVYTLTNTRETETETERETTRDRQTAKERHSEAKTNYTHIQEKLILKQ